MVSLYLLKLLLIVDLIFLLRGGLDVWVVYQGVLGVYSEVVVVKVYLRCEVVLCEQFEVVFLVVEFWLVDRVVLLIENLFGGSIYRNYDFLFCYCLYIVGEVQFIVYYCLMVVFGVKKKEFQ